MVEKKLWKALAAACAAGMIIFQASGVEKPTVDEGTAEMVAKFTSVPVKIDGTMDEPAWNNAPAYQLTLPMKAYANQPESIQKALGNALREQGRIKLLWDGNYLYVGSWLEDSDAVNTGKHDQEELYVTGDLIEVFLKPKNESYYWEIYGSVNNKKTWYFYISKGRQFLSGYADYLPADLKSAATVDGSINNWRDKDKSWTLEIAIPLKELNAQGVKFDNSSNWTILVSRYNYSRYLPRVELSSYPRLSNPNFHICGEYAMLLLEK